MFIGVSTVYEQQLLYGQKFIYSMYLIK